MAISNHIELEPEHLSVIKALADETHRSMNDVNKLYVETFEKLSWMRASRTIWFC